MPCCVFDFGTFVGGIFETVQQLGAIRINVQNKQKKSKNVEKKKQNAHKKVLTRSGWCVNILPTNFRINKTYDSVGYWFSKFDNV